MLKKINQNGQPGVLMELKFLIMMTMAQSITVASHYNFRQLAGNMQHVLRSDHQYKIF